MPTQATGAEAPVLKEARRQIDNRGADAALAIDTINSTQSGLAEGLALEGPRLAREVMDSAKSMLLRSTTAAPKPELRTSIRFATTFATFDA